MKELIHAHFDKIMLVLLFGMALAGTITLERRERSLGTRSDISHSRLFTDADNGRGADAQEGRKPSRSTEI